MELTDITKAYVGGDLARPNLFEVEIPFMGKDFKFKCKAASMPSGVVEPIPVSYQNKKLKLAGDRTYEDWTITVYNDTDHNARQQFIAWQNLAQAMDRNISGEAPTSYKKEATIRQLDRKGAATRSYTMYGIWPTNIAELQLSWDQSNEVETFEVTMSLDWWQ